MFLKMIKVSKTGKDPTTEDTASSLKVLCKSSTTMLDNFYPCFEISQLCKLANYANYPIMQIGQIRVSQNWKSADFRLPHARAQLYNK